MSDPLSRLEAVLDSRAHARVAAIPCPRVHEFILDAAELCGPESVFVVTDSREDRDRVRRLAVERGEEIPLATPGHTVHFDGYYDQARDVENTKYLVPEGDTLDSNLRQMPRGAGLREVRGLLRGAMSGREMIVRFFSLAPPMSEFAIPCIQVTDSYYVAHSEDLLYRPGYEMFKQLDAGSDFFKVVHSMGRTRNGVSQDVDKRRIYIDYSDEVVYAVNTQYAGNTVGFKKLALRLAIRKADREGWLAEHMFIMGVHGPGGRKTYFTGAFPSACGKTSTAMIQGETIVGDDLAYLRKRDGRVWAANVERGIFGIIRGVNAEETPILWEVLHSPGEVIFSNVLVVDGHPYWLRDNREVPEEGINFAGRWRRGARDAEGNEIPHAHRNARYTVPLSSLPNIDERAEDPQGVPIGGVIYGGRDPDTQVPVKEAFDWAHGVITMGAALESQTTAATLGLEGVRSFQPFSNIDFISIPLGKYVQNHLAFVEGLDHPPKVFGVNYFLRDYNDERFLNEKRDKAVWLKWMELRVHGEVAAIRAPTGLFPVYDDLKRLFQSVLDKDYRHEDYVEQFTVRVPEWLHKTRLIRSTYEERAPQTPRTLFDVLDAQEQRLKDAQDEFGPYISPEVFP